MKTLFTRLGLAIILAAVVAVGAFLASGGTLTHGNSIFAGAATNPALPLTGKVIVVDAGHGGHDPGTEQDYSFCSLTAPAGQTKIHEKDITLLIATKLAADLEAKGATVYMTRETDVFVDLWDRVAMSADVSKTPKGQRNHVAKRAADIFISIHVNSVDYKTNFDEIGVYSYFQPGKELGLKLAPVLQKEMAKNTRVIHPMDFRVIDHNSTIPSVLIETGFITNAATCRDLVNDAYQDRFAAAVTKGVEDYFTNTGAGKGVNVTITDPTKQKKDKHVEESHNDHHNKSHKGNGSGHKKHKH